MTQSTSYLRGAFIAYESGGYPDKKRVIPFRFNPESLSRSLSVEQGSGGSGTEGSASSSASSSGSDGASDASSGSVKESFKVLVRVDFADRLEATQNLPAELGVAPEIAAIEDLLYPAETEAQASSDGTEPVRQKLPRPTVLLVWGRKRVLPVKITGLTINEAMYNSQLNPIRADIEVSVEVLGELDAADNAAVKSALDFTSKNRRELAKKFYDNTANQSSNILPI